MAEEKIYCPNCKAEISITEALFNQIKARARGEFEAEVKKREGEFKKREEDLAKRAKEIDESVSRKLSAERDKMAIEARNRAKEEVSIEQKALMDDLADTKKKLDEAQRNELTVRKMKREIEEKGKELELRMERMLAEERDKIRLKTLEEFSEEHRLKDLEKDKVINDLKKTSDELKRKLEQGSMQTQGEVAELDLEEMLRNRFTSDSIEPVAKGIRGADILQRIFTRTGQPCGTIAWEAKRTKLWNDDWIAKLKDDQREVKAELGVIVTEALPKGLSNFGPVDGVWVVSFPLALNLAEALRVSLIQLAQSRASVVGKNEKMEAVYNYLSGPEFRHRIEGVVDAFKHLKEGLDQEKKAMWKIWAKREKQIERAVMNTARMYGDMHGIIGATLPEIKALELGEGGGGGGEGGVGGGDEREGEEEGSIDEAPQMASGTHTNAEEVGKGGAGGAGGVGGEGGS